MSFIQWNANLSVGVGEIDRQHQQLVKLINDLDDAMSRGEGKTIVGQIVGSLLRYAQSHFATEETYFKQFGYPETAIHVREHVDFCNRAAEFKRDFDSGRIGLSLSVMNFLGGWLTNHIKGMDQKYSPFFREKGLK